MQLSEQLIYCTTKIINIIDETKIATGTGFFMNFNENLEKGTCQPVIITNKHVVKDAKKIIFSVCRADENNNPLDQQKFTITLDEFKIINHPDNDVDLCAIPIASLDSYSQEYKVRLYRGKLGTDLIINEDEVKDCSAMEDIIMIGYPNGLEDSYNNKPIIRKGITSTHLKFDYNGKKEFLIDMACFPGSSGSPIFFCNESSYTQGNATFFGSRCKLLGLLYGGPQHTSTGSVVFENIPTNPKDKHKLIIDEEASKNVIKIFNDIIEGKTASEIANELNSNNVLTPASYKIKNNNIEVDKKWNVKMINVILQNRVYTGDLIQWKKKVESYRTHKLITTNKDEWIIVENNHEPIISKEEFDADCGSSFTVRKVKNYEYYHCTSYVRNGACTSHSIRKDKLVEIVLEELNKKIKRNKIDTLTRDILLKNINSIIISQDGEVNVKLK